MPAAAAHAQHPRAPPFVEPPGYVRHRPESTLLFQLIGGRLAERILRVRCEHCHAEKLVAFSCKKGGFCPSCGARRMADAAALRAAEALPERPLRQWVLSLPIALRFLLATDPDALMLVRGEAHRAISGYLLKAAGLTRTTGESGTVTLIQRFGSALNLNVHFHTLFLDGAYLIGDCAPRSAGAAALECTWRGIAGYSPHTAISGRPSRQRIEARVGSHRQKRATSLPLHATRR
jgi:hypothetical protein